LRTSTEFGMQDGAAIRAGHRLRGTLPQGPPQSNTTAAHGNSMAAGNPALIFDLDGTLVDSLADLRTAINRLLQELGLPPISLAEARDMLGDGASAFVGRALEDRGVKPNPAEHARLTRRYLDFYEAHPARDTWPYPGVPETLERLRRSGHGCAVCTNKPKRAAEAVLEAVGLAQFFAAVVCPEDVLNRKPHPDHLAAAIAALGPDAMDAVMIGDSANDVRPARALGIPVVVVDYGYSLEPVRSLGADLVLRRFADLEAALAAPPWRRG
jgi:phosphoglycolate phosphatase